VNANKQYIYGHIDSDGRPVKRSSSRMRCFICHQKHASACKVTRRIPNAVARHRLKPPVNGTTSRPPDAYLPAESSSTRATRLPQVLDVSVSFEVLASEGYRLPCTPQGLRSEGRISKGGLAQGHQPQQRCASGPGCPETLVGFNHCQ